MQVDRTVGAPLPRWAGALVMVTVFLVCSALVSAAPKIALVPPGPHPYFAPWEDSARDATRDFGVQVDYRVPQTWSLSDQNTLIESLVAQGYTAVGLFPGDPRGTNAMIATLKSRGIPAVNLAGCTFDPTDALMCLGTDVYESAYVHTKYLIEAIGGSGNIVHIAGFLTDPNTHLRMEAVEKAVAETDGRVKLLTTLTDADSEQEAFQKINSLLATRASEINGLMSTNFVGTMVAAQMLMSRGLRSITLIGQDDSDAVLEAIRQGYAYGTMMQNPYGQGYIGAYLLKRVSEGCQVKDDAPWLTTPQTGRFVNSGLFLLTADNLDTYQEEVRALTLDLLSDFEDTYLSCEG